MYSDSKIRKDHIFIVAVISTLIFSSMTVVNGSTNMVNGQSNTTQTNSSDTNNLVNIQDIPLQKVHVGDIEMAYKMFGKGDPILLISPAQADMNYWEPSLIDTLSANHTVIVFDNRGVGNTSTGIKPFSIQQFANDTAGLIDALKVQNATVLGYSLGSFITQQLAVAYPEKVNRLVLIATTCGGKESIPPSPEPQTRVIDVINRIANDTPVTSQEVKALLSDGLGSGWLKLHPNFLETIPIPEVKDLFPSITPDNNLKQFNAALDW
ncbi:MAG TPA: alpha/beta hydrolase, partial [Candidatus Nitrosocosmicus sp.]|nr:alpha/beta hydrolase [Candidatus Nitrosocosmicus sp.]